MRVALAAQAGSLDAGRRAGRRGPGTGISGRAVTDAGRSSKALTARCPWQGRTLLPALPVARSLPPPGRPTALYLLLPEVPAGRGSGDHSALTASIPHWTVECGIETRGWSRIERQ